MRNWSARIFILTLVLICLFGGYMEEGDGFSLFYRDTGEEMVFISWLQVAGVSLWACVLAYWIPALKRMKEERKAQTKAILAAFDDQYMHIRYKGKGSK
jgi:hypothetical protein